MVTFVNARARTSSTRRGPRRARPLLFATVLGGVLGCRDNTPLPFEPGVRPAVRHGRSLTADTPRAPAQAGALPPSATPGAGTALAAPGVSTFSRPVLRMPDVAASSLTSVDAVVASFRCLDDGATSGEWFVRFAGYGCAAVGTVADAVVLALRPAVATAAAETHATMILGPAATAASVSLRVRAELLTERQLRSGSAPNAWEVGWLVWHYADDDHFYYLIAKPNGWELGKRDPLYPGGQRFLATGSEPRFPVGVWHELSVAQHGSTITVRAGGVHLTTFDDAERPYTSGRVGVYSEDAAVVARAISTSS